ncbi:hypothetical protein GGR54DRAFT_641652 [Hypoxylon sp. NC1633]|nr:hypothetical protein GGR54DRAFT_641652 [Hypoxylon sp. NC1633]
MSVNVSSGKSASSFAFKQPRIPSYQSPNPFVSHPLNCTCEYCAWMRPSRHYMDPRLTPEPDVVDDDTIPQPQPKTKAAAKQAAKQITAKQTTAKPDPSPQPTQKSQRSGSATPPPYPRPGMLQTEVYVYPRTSHHLTFPVVNYSAAHREAHPSSWPTCYLAISPQCALPADFEATLAPAGSGLVAVARLSRTRMIAPFADFKSIQELRRDSIQLEVWDEPAGDDDRGEVEIGREIGNGNGNGKGNRNRNRNGGEAGVANGGMGGAASRKKK